MNSRIAFLLAVTACVAEGFKVVDDCKCGQKYGAGSRIVGGTQASEGEWPWQVAVARRGSQMCGGSVLNNLYVITAAHCFFDQSGNQLPASQFQAWMNTYDLEDSTDRVTRSISEIIIHENYNSGTQRNDIALMKLSSPIQLNEEAVPVCLPPSKPTYAGKNAIATGWGATSSGGFGPDILREVTVPVLSHEQCQDTDYGNSITANMLCAGVTGKDSCQGDSGGPLVFKDGGNNYDLIGITSWGIGCGDNGYPGVYTRVNKYLDWIDSNTQDAEYCTGWNPNA